jgi:DNA helicase-2/ATP-dependent DNA helicase PcrA
VRLSKEQEAACRLLEGPVRVVAGAGTGKTTVIVERCRRLVERGVDPRTILVLTFTERAAAEMRHRIVAAVAAAEAAHVGTFHAVALSWLREDGALVGLRPGFQLLTGPDRWISMRELMWELADPAFVLRERPDDLVSPLLQLQERLKQELVPLARLAAWAERDPDPERRASLGAAARLFRAHASRCRREGLIDFDDLIALVVELLERRPDVRERYARRLRWLLIDEHQDTNLAQQRLIELLAGPSGNVCVVGDDDQSIYRFRGASRASFARFVEAFPEATTLTLGQNRRSAEHIVGAARRLIERNPERVVKPLRAEGGVAGDRVEVWRCPDGAREAAAVVGAIARLHECGLPLREIGVLTRTHAVAGPVVEGLAAAGLPFQRRCAEGLFRRPEVRDVIAYLRFLHDPTDLLALARLLTRPPVGADLTEGVRRIRAGTPDQGGRGPLGELEGWAPAQGWSRVVAELVPLKESLGVVDLLFEVLERTRYLDHALRGRDPAEARRIVANVSRFAELVGEYCERRRDHSLGPFVEYLDLVLRSGVDEEEAEREGPEDAVQVLSIHQAKGLEFECVFMPAMVEGRLPQPHRREPLAPPVQILEPLVRGREDHVAEERRLCYVGMTRARRRLVLSWAERYEGARQWRPSRFLAELGDEVRRLDLAGEGDLRPPASPPAPRPELASELRRPALSPTNPPAHRGVRGSRAEEEGVILSYSAISAYRECPRQHWYRYRLGLPAPPAVEAQFGTVLHLALLGAGRLRQRGLRLDRAALRELYQAAWDRSGPRDPRRRRALEPLGREMLETFWERGGLDAAPRLLEQPFEASMGAWTLRGVIDRVDEAGDAASKGRWRIVDYKTGSPQPASQLRRDLQLALYALGAREALGTEVARPEDMELEVVYLRDGRRSRLTASAELLDEARRIGDEVASAVLEGRFGPRPDRRRCSLCAYRLTCEAAL